MTVGLSGSTVYGLAWWADELPPGGALPQGDPLYALLLAWFITVCGVGAWKLGTLRTDVTEDVVRIKGFWTTTTIDRAEVVGFEVAPVGRFNLDTIAVVTRAGRRVALRGLEGAVQVPVWVTGHGFVTLPRAARILTDLLANFDHRGTEDGVSPGNRHEEDDHE